MLKGSTVAPGDPENFVATDGEILPVMTWKNPSLVGLDEARTENSTGRYMTMEWSLSVCTV